MLDPSAVTSVYRPAKGSIISLKHHLSWVGDLFLQHVRGKGRRNSPRRTSLHCMSVTDHLCHEESATAVLWNPGLEMVSVKPGGSQLTAVHVHTVQAQQMKHMAGEAINWAAVLGLIVLGHHTRCRTIMDALCSKCYR